MDLNLSGTFCDIDDDGYLENTGWAGADDGILAIDLNGDGVIDRADEIVFTMHAPGEASDLPALSKDTDARWTLKVGGKVRTRPDGVPLPMIALLVFGYKSHISIDRRFGFIRGQAVTSASAPDGRQLQTVVCTDNTSGEVWADSAYRSRRNEKWLASRMLVSRIHRRKPAGKPMPKATARANAKKSSIRVRVEHGFGHQKSRYGLFIRTIRIKRAEAKPTLANLAYNFDRLIFHERRGTTG